jgi:N-acetylmuramic acid 6-phosphate etherase
LRVAGAADAASAWRDLLGREPRSLDWPELGGRAARGLLLGFDFSRDLPPAGPVAAREDFRLARWPEGISLRLGEAAAFVPADPAGPDALGDHLVLKMLLNAHSTLVMGRLGRYDGNLMTWVRPSNHKLVDRAVRYADLLLRRDGIAISYARLAEACFALQADLPPDRPLVKTLVERFKREESGLSRHSFACAD